MIERVELSRINPTYKENVEYLGKCLITIQEKTNEEFVSEIKEISKRFDYIKELYEELGKIYSNKYDNLTIKSITPSFEDWLEMVFNIFAAEFTKRVKDKYSDELVKFWVSFYFSKFLERDNDKIKDATFELYQKDDVAVFTEIEIINHLEQILLAS